MHSICKLPSPCGPNLGSQAKLFILGKLFSSLLRYLDTACFSKEENVYFFFFQQSVFVLAIYSIAKVQILFYEFNFREATTMNLAYNLHRIKRNNWDMRQFLGDLGTWEV